MSDDKKDLPKDGDDKKDPNKDGDDKTKDKGGTKPTVEDLQAEIAKKDETIENLKGTQSAISKNLEEIKTQVGSYKDSFEKAGIDPKDLNSLIEKQSRSNTLIQVAAEKGLSASDMEFITGSSKEEIEASVEKFQAVIQKNIDASLASNKKEEDKDKKVIIPKNNNKSDPPKLADEAAAVDSFLSKKGMIPTKK